MRAQIRHLLDRLPYVGRLRAEVRQAGAFPAGHFYSPLPAQEDIAVRLASANSFVPGVDLNLGRQRDILDNFAVLYRDLPFSETPSPTCRYTLKAAAPFPHADAIFLYAFLRHVQPKRIIEVGSGHSSAVMLDTIERYFPTPPQLTLIEPFPANLKALLRPADEQRLTLLETKVQDVPLGRFTGLQTGDLLFIDSSHVLKCGSDLQFLLFDVLPRLNVGVYVHFHDIFAGFEYPKVWLEQGWYWNEAYLLRAFLSFNQAWEIVLFGNYAVTTWREWFQTHMPLCLKNEGGSLYLRRIA